MSFIKANWPAPATIHTLVTTRNGGISNAPYETLNLGDHVGDQVPRVLGNRQILRKHLPQEPLWLKQTHSTVVSTPATRAQNPDRPLEADAAVTDIANEVLVIMTADCLPVLLTNADGSVVGAAHAGWRGLLDGILEETVGAALTLCTPSRSKDFIAWLGPAIGPESFEVGSEVCDQFQSTGLHDVTQSFVPIPNKPGKYLANLYQLARDRLEAVGVSAIFGGDLCTVQDEERFFSYRRDGVTGRFGSLIWIAS
jgi:YfiH family protein